ncbi:MAG: transcriptional regulator AsnC [Gammaproteobacteria bacterium]|jgi:Lrp/AsnC family transcriptional regulator for asnA, asnC and gidA
MIDELDKQILTQLMADAKVSYAQMARQFDVSPATIHVRIEKLRAADIIQGTEIRVDPKALGFDVVCFIGIKLNSAGDYPDVLEQLKSIPAVTEAYYTTGQYSILIKIMTYSIDDLQHLLIEKVQSIAAIQSTETLISLQNGIQRQLSL